MSTSSACTAGRDNPSHVLLALGLSSKKLGQRFAFLMEDIILLQKSKK